MLRWDDDCYGLRLAEGFRDLRYTRFNIYSLLFVFEFSLLAFDLSLT